jgi:hypothetical protein
MSILGGCTKIPTYTEEHIAHLPDSDDDNKIIDEYDNITWEGTQQL